MKCRCIIAATAAILLFGSATTSFLDKPSVITYWGQNSQDGTNTQKGLSFYCDDNSDVIIMSFVYNFANGNLPSLNLADSCNSYFSGTNLLKCTDIGDDIKTCQSNGKTVLMSLGGAEGIYGFQSDSDAKAFADTLWNIFGGGSSHTRPFGDAVLDGFDLDIEGGGSTGYASMVTQLRKNFATDKSKQYYITGAPQCPYPDAMMSSVLNSVAFDAVNVQFYNNYCSVTSDSFNYNTWHKWATQASLNKNVKVLIGLPGSISSAGSGYVPFNSLKPAIQGVYEQFPDTFGGIMLWDASTSHANIDVSPSYQVNIANLIHGLSDGSSVMTATTTTTTTRTSARFPTTTSSKTSTTTSSTPIKTSTKSSIKTSTKTNSKPRTKSITKKTSSKSSTKSHMKPTTKERSTTSKSSTKATATSTTQVPATNDKSKSFTTTMTKSQSVKTTSTTTNKSPISTSNPTCISQDQACSTEGKLSCSGNSFGICDHRKWTLRSCPNGLTCFSTTDGSSIYCGQGTSSGDNTCSIVFVQENIALVSTQVIKESDTVVFKSFAGPSAKPYKGSHIVAQFSVITSNQTWFSAVINARRLDQSSFGSIVTLKFKVSDSIQVTSVNNGKVSQSGNSVKIQYTNPYNQTVASLIQIQGKVKSGQVFVAPTVNSMKFL